MSWLLVGYEEVIVSFQDGRYLTNLGRMVSRPTPKNKHVSFAKKAGAV